MSLKQVVRWLRANLLQLGCNLELLDIENGTDAVISALRCEFPRACSLKAFYEGLYGKKNSIQSKYSVKSRVLGLEKTTKKHTFGDNLQSAEQFIMLANMGLAVDKREKKHD